MLALKTPGLELPKSVQNITLAKYKLMLEHTACICIVKEWAEQHTSENSGQLTLRWVYYNHALKQVAYLFNKVIICVQTHATMVVRLMLIFSLINGL